MRNLPLSGLRLGIFGKGGAGKSTVTVLLAGALEARGYSVVVLDADSTNVGLAAALDMAAEPRPLLDHFGGMVFSGGRVTCPVDDPTPLPGASISLTNAPAAVVAEDADGVRLLVAGKLGALGPGAGCDGPIAKIARDLELTDVGPDDVLLVDFKAGFEDSARGALTSLDWVLVVVDPTVAGIQMAVHLADMAKQIHRGVPPATAHLESPELVALAEKQFREARVKGVLAVMNRIPNSSTEQHIRRALSQEGPPVVGVLGRDAGIDEQWLHGARLVPGGGGLAPQVEDLVSGLEDAVARAGDRMDATAREVGS